MKQIIYYGAADAYLLDMQIKNNKNINKNLLLNIKIIYFECRSVDDLVAKIFESEKAKTKKVVDIARQAPGISNKGEFIKNNLSNKYIVSYHKKRNNFIQIIKKELFHNQTLEKYLLLV